MEDNTNYVYYGIICKEFEKKFMLIKMRDGFIVTEQYYTHKYQPGVVVYQDKNKNTDPFKDIQGNITKVNQNFYIMRKPTGEDITPTDIESIKNFLNQHFDFGDKPIHVYDYISKDDILVPIFLNFDEMEKRLRDFMNKIIEVESITSIKPNLDDGTNHIVVKKTFDDKYFIVNKLYKLIFPYEKPYDVVYGILKKFELETLYFNIISIMPQMAPDPDKCLEIGIKSVEKLNIKIERMFTVDDVNDALQSAKATIVGKPYIFKYNCEEENK